MYIFDGDASENHRRNGVGQRHLDPREAKNQGRDSGGDTRNTRRGGPALLAPSVQPTVSEPVPQDPARQERGYSRLPCVGPGGLARGTSHFLLAKFLSGGFVAGIPVRREFNTRALPTSQASRKQQEESANKDQRQ